MKYTANRVRAAMALATALALSGSTMGQATPGRVALQNQALIAKGDSVFHGLLGGALCHVCHGRNAKGMPGLGSDLTDSTWLHADGSLESIMATIRTGVARPKASKTVMPPGGGVPLDSLLLRAVATYVYSLGSRR